jgi:hypothetical protein
VAGSGDLGPSWSSAIGGGLGRRGELDGERGVAVIFVVNECEDVGCRVRGVELCRGLLLSARCSLAGLGSETQAEGACDASPEAQ